MEFKLYFLGFFLTTLSVASCAVPFTNCNGAKSGPVTEVDIVGCSAGTTCILHRGANSTIQIQFIAGSGTSKVTSLVHGVIQGVPVPFNFPYPDACTYGGLSCPLAPNTAYTYTATLPIKKMYPKISVEIKWQLQNEHEEDILCVQIPVRIK